LKSRRNIRQTAAEPGEPGEGEVMARGNADTLPRQWLLLRNLPRAPQRATAGDLARRLDEAGYPITKRSVERDLQTLSAQFPIEVDDRSKPYGWSWQRDAPTFSMPGMSPLQAAVLLTANAHLHQLLPAHQLKELTPLMEQARRTLAATAEGDEPTWPERVAVAPTTQALLPPTTDDLVLVRVHEAIFRSKQLEIVYRGRGSTELRHYRIHPLGLIVRGPVTYMAVRIGDYKDVRTLAIHRIEAAELVDRPAVAPRGFRIGDMVSLVAGGFATAPLIKLELSMEEFSAEHLLETPLSLDQTILPADQQGWVRISASVADTAQLRWWLMGFGSAVEVLSPKKLRSDLAKECELSFKKYK
jgi:predicted DNA-binding transcriptional regulator YafY